jgi:hypothetical protein
LVEAGAAAVIAVTSTDLQWNFLLRSHRRATIRQVEPAGPSIGGAMPRAALDSLLSAAGGDPARLSATSGAGFRALALPLRVDLQATTHVRTFESHNVVGRLRGTGRTGEHILFLAHWDHFGVCRPETEADRICNGAVDNASGIAALIEIAGRLRQARPLRDVIFLATTAEEVGLLGAEFFARHPPVERSSILAGVNIDTIAIHPAGEPVAVVGHGNAALDAAIAESITAMGRLPDPDRDADMLAQRHDGAALTRAGIPSVVVGGSFANMTLLNAFLSGPYHGPDDEPGPSLPLDGAAEDANLMVDLGRRLGDPTRFQGPPGR